MNLELLRKFGNKRKGGIKQLASDIGMSEANLHRCINNNKIQASDLERAARLLMVNICTFFDEDVCVKHSVVKKEGDNSPASMYGDALVTSNNRLLEERIKSYKQQLEDNKKMIEDKERIIKLLMERKEYGRNE